MLRSISFYYLLLLECHKSKAVNTTGCFREEPESIIDEEGMGGGTVEEQAEVTNNYSIITTHASTCVL